MLLDIIHSSSRQQNCQGWQRYNQSQPSSGIEQNLDIPTLQPLLVDAAMTFVIIHLTASFCSLNSPASSYESRLILRVNCIRLLELIKNLLKYSVNSAARITFDRISHITYTFKPFSPRRSLFSAMTERTFIASPTDRQKGITTIAGTPYVAEVVD